jgi:HEAT repeat protein
MGEPKDPSRRIRKLLDRLAECETLPKDEREAVAGEVAAEARALPREDVLRAIDRAVGRNKKRRLQSVYILAELRDVPEVIDRITAGLESPDAEWRSWVIQTVERWELRHCGDALARIIASDPDTFCREVAIHAAGALRLPECMPPILALARQEAHDWAVTCALASYATEECRPYLARTFEASTYKDLRVMAAWGLARLNEPQALPYLVEMLDDPDQRGDTYFHPGQSLRAAQAVCDLHGWPFTWNKEYVVQTKQRMAGLGRTSGH